MVMSRVTVLGNVHEVTFTKDDGMVGLQAAVRRACGKSVRVVPTERVGPVTDLNMLLWARRLYYEDGTLYGGFGQGGVRKAMPLGIEVATANGIVLPRLTEVRCRVLVRKQIAQVSVPVNDDTTVGNFKMKLIFDHGLALEPNKLFDEDPFDEVPNATLLCDVGGLNRIVATKSVTTNPEQWSWYKDLRDDTDVCEIYVKTLTGKTITFSVRPLEHTVHDLKMWVHTKEGIPSDQQRIIYAGQQLEDHRLLSAYTGDNLNGACFHLVIRLRGGMYHESSGRTDLTTRRRCKLDVFTADGSSVSVTVIRRDTLDDVLKKVKAQLPDDLDEDEDDDDEEEEQEEEDEEDAASDDDQRPGESDAAYAGRLKRKLSELRMYTKRHRV